jgi:WD40 repeat protein
LSANGARAALTGPDGCVHVWDLATGKELRSIKCGGEDDLVAVALTPDGTGLLVSALGPRIVLWEVATGKELRRFECQPSPNDPTGGVSFPKALSGLVFSPDGKLLAAPLLEGPDSGLLLWDVATGKEVPRAGERLRGSGPVPSRIVPGGIIERGNGKGVLVLERGELNLVRPAFSPDGKLVTRVARDGTIHLHNTSTGKEVLAAGEAGKGSPVIGLAFAPDGKRFAALQSDQTVRLHDSATGKVLVTCAGSGEQAVESNRLALLNTPAYYSGSDVPPACFSPDGKTLAAASGRNTVRLWDPATGKPLPLPAGHHGQVLDVIPSGEGTTVTTRGADRTLRRWEIATGREVRRLTLPTPDEHPGVLSPSGQLFAYPADDKTVHLWDTTAVGTPSVAFRRPN